MICRPCQEPHHEEDCIDNQRKPPRKDGLRWCYCQHAPRADGRQPKSRRPSRRNPKR